MSQVVQFATPYPTWEESLDSFLLFRAAQGMKERTLKDYRYHVTRFYRTFPEAFAPARVKTLALKHMGDDMAPATFNIRRKYLKAFFDWCVGEGIYPRNPLDGIKSRKAEPRIVDTPIDAVGDLLALCNPDTFCGVRDRALILLQVDTGIRPCEALRLSPADVDLAQTEVRVRPKDAKTGRGRVLPLNPQTVIAIRKLEAIRPEEWRESPLFCTETGNPWRVDAWGNRLRTVYSPRLGRRVNPYDLRHIHALSFLRQGGNLFALQREMGHTDLSMTRRYAAVTDSDVRTEHAKASPLNLITTAQVRAPRKIRG